MGVIPNKEPKTAGRRDPLSRKVGQNRSLESPPELVSGNDRIPKGSGIRAHGMEETPASHVTSDATGDAFPL